MSWARIFWVTFPSSPNAAGAFHRLTGRQVIAKPIRACWPASAIPLATSLISGGEDGKVLRIVGRRQRDRDRRSAAQVDHPVAAGPSGRGRLCHGKTATVVACRWQRRRISPSNAPSRASPLRPRACASPSPATTASSLHWVGTNGAARRSRMEGRP